MGAKFFKSELTISNSGFLFDHGSGLTYSLNATGQFIFMQLEAGIEPPKIIKTLNEEYEVTEETARKDVDDFLRQLSELGIVE